MWPTSLPETFESKSYNSEVMPSYIESDMEFGPKKRRARFTGQQEKLAGSMVLSTAQVNTLREFYRVGTGGGVLSFSFVHPETKIPTMVRFDGAPKMAHIGGEYFTAAIAFEVVA